MSTDVFLRSLRTYVDPCLRYNSKLVELLVFVTFFSFLKAYSESGNWLQEYIVILYDILVANCRSPKVVIHVRLLGYDVESYISINY